MAPQRDCVGLDADDLDARLGEGHREGQADVSHADDCDLHCSLPFRLVAAARRRRRDRRSDCIASARPAEARRPAAADSRHGRAATRGRQPQRRLNRRRSFSHGGPAQTSTVQRLPGPRSCSPWSCRARRPAPRGRGARRSTWPRRRRRGRSGWPAAGRAGRRRGPGPGRAGRPPAPPPAGALRGRDVVARPSRGRGSGWCGRAARPRARPRRSRRSRCRAPARGVGQDVVGTAGACRAAGRARARRRASATRAGGGG